MTSQNICDNILNPSKLKEKMSLVLRHVDRRHKRFQNIYYNNKYNTNYNHFNTKKSSKNNKITFIYNDNANKIFYDITVILIKKYVSECCNGKKYFHKKWIINEYFNDEYTNLNDIEIKNNHYVNWLNNNEEQLILIRDLEYLNLGKIDRRDYRAEMRMYSSLHIFDTQCNNGNDIKVPHGYSHKNDVCLNIYSDKIAKRGKHTAYRYKLLNKRKDSIKIYTKLDVYDKKEKKWYIGEVVNIKNNVSHIKVSFDGYSSCFDAWYPIYSSEIAKLHTYTKLDSNLRKYGYYKHKESSDKASQKIKIPERRKLSSKRNLDLPGYPRLYIL